MLILLYYHIFFFATKVYYVTLSHLVCFMYNVLRICKMKPLFFHIISIMYVFVFYVFFSSPYCALYLFIVYVIPVNDLSIVLNIFSINIRFTDAKITDIIILHLFVFFYMSVYVYFTDSYSLIMLSFQNTNVYFNISPS